MGSFSSLMAALDMEFAEALKHTSVVSTAAVVKSHNALPALEPLLNNASCLKEGSEGPEGLEGSEGLLRGHNSA